jgi:hypothetical protein
MKNIPITQYLHPTGNTRAVTCDVDDDVAYRYENVIKPLGLRVTAECIQHSHFVNLCLEEPELGDFVCVLAENLSREPEIVVEALASLIRNFHVEEYKFWRSAQLNGEVLDG